MGKYDWSMHDTLRIYIATNESGEFKVGVSYEPEQRMKNLSWEHEQKYTLIGLVPFMPITTGTHHVYANTIEARIHKRLKFHPTIKPGHSGEHYTCDFRTLLDFIQEILNEVKK